MNENVMKYGTIYLQTVLRYQFALAKKLINMQKTVQLKLY